MATMATLFDVSPEIVRPPQAGLYRVLYADPPWLERGGGKIKRGADRHYPLMKTKDIAALPVRSWMADDCQGYIWVTNNFLPDGLLVLAAWGFDYITKIDWFKGDVDDDPVADDVQADAALEAGLGQYYRGVTESCLFGSRGHNGYAFLPNGKRAQGRTGFHASRRSLVEHSKKPEQMRTMIERVSPRLPRLEMFARRAAPGWDVWGNEAPEVHDGSQTSLGH